MTRVPGTSIQFRLTTAFTALLAITFLLIGLGVWLALNHSIDKTADRELHSRLAEVRKYFNSFTPDDLTHLEEEFKEEALLGQASANIRIADGHGRWLFRTPGSEHWPEETLAVADLPQRGITKTIRIRHQSIRILTAPVRLGAVQIGLPVGEFEEVKTDFLWLLGLGSPLLLLAAGLGGFWMAGRALHPVAEIAQKAARISAQELSARLPANGTGDELDRLSGVLNSMLERLESAFRRVTEFTADASHELRTPVAIIQTTAELMQSRVRTPEEHLKAWARVSEQTAGTTRLIADLLTLARADAGKTDFELQRIDLANVVAKATEEMRVLAESKGLTLTREGSSLPCWVQGDADALGRVVCILLDNAIQFSTHFSNPPGTIHIEVQSGKQAALMVSDTGTGIGQADLGLIFERFYRVSKDRSRRSGGSGLGLSIGRWIVEQHGGEMVVTSAVGKGSQFTMLLRHCR